LIKATAAITKKLLPPANNKKSVHNYLYRLASLASKNSIEIYLSAGVDIFEDYQQHFNTTAAHYLQPMLTDFEAIANAPMSGLQKIMNIDFDCNLFSDLLVKMDIATMAHSLEGRSPFLCKELLEYIPGLPDEYKVKGRTTKYLLRQLAQQYLPAPLIHQPKRGFEIPLKTWVNTVLKEIIHDYCGSPNAYSRQFISPAFLQALLNNTQNIPAEKRAKMLWTLLSLEVWHKKAFN
jgi:asparagine synthase (glutamine-hydrolysing)